MGHPRAIFFVDGENLTMRYQAMVSEGRTPLKDVRHRPDVFVWHNGITDSGLYRFYKILRTCYYTSVVGDEAAVVSVKRDLAQCAYSSKWDDGGLYGTIVPVVFKKLAKSQKTRNVDIQIVIDIMRFAFTDQIDRIYLASGDGDYLPLINEAMRRGKQVELLAFSSGLNRELEYSADEFFCIDNVFFEPLAKPSSPS